MLKDFRKNLKNALRIRRNAELPGFGWLVPAAVVFTFIYCVLAIFLVPGDKPPEFNFQEGGMIMALSAITLAAAAGFALTADLIHFRDTGKHQWLWLIFAAGFVYLSFDELVQFHERADNLVLERIFPPEIFQNWNDMIVVMYGVIAIPVVFVLLPTLLKYRHVPEMFFVAFVFYAIHTFIDSTQDPATLTSQIFEESAKAFSTVFLLLGAFNGVLANIGQNSDLAAKANVELEKNEESIVPQSLPEGYGI